MRRSCFAMVMVAALWLLPMYGCRATSSSDEDLHVVTGFSSPVARVGSDMLSIRLTGLDGKPISSAAITVETEMSHPGMAPGQSTAVPTGNGSFQAPVVFSMPGDYVIELHIALSSGKRVDRRIAVNGVTSRQESK